MSSEIDSMKQLDIYDPAMCCSTGVCGPQVDPVLIRFSADVKWLQERGVEVRRFNLSQNPMAFVENEPVRQSLTEKGEAALPLLLLDGREIASGFYPDRTRLAELVGLNHTDASLFTPRVKELVAIGAAIAANCEPCLRHHIRVARELGVSLADIAHSIEMAAKVKEVPHQAVLELGARLTDENTREPETARSVPPSASSAALNV
jgi:AhpD family alkylhydroperoxidase